LLTRKPKNKNLALIELVSHAVIATPIIEKVICVDKSESRKMEHKKAQAIRSKKPNQ
jgi:hypothetical protein